MEPFREKFRSNSNEYAKNTYWLPIALLGVDESSPLNLALMATEEPVMDSA